MTLTLTDKVIYAEKSGDDGIIAVIHSDDTYYAMTGTQLVGDHVPSGFDMRFLHVDSTRTDSRVPNGIIVALSYKDQRYELKGTPEFEPVASDAFINNLLPPGEMRTFAMSERRRLRPFKLVHGHDSALTSLIDDLERDGYAVFGEAYDRWVESSYQDLYGSALQAYHQEKSFSQVWHFVAGIAPTEV